MKLDLFLLSFARYHYAMCKYMSTMTQSPYWYQQRELAGADVSELESRVLVDSING